jgi:hypothetical protein
MVANMGQISFADSLQNFLALAQAGSPNGEVGASSYTDQQQFVGDNGLVSTYFDTSFSLNLGDFIAPDAVDHCLTGEQRTVFRISLGGAHLPL